MRAISRGVAVLAAAALSAVAAVPADAGVRAGSGAPPAAGNTVHIGPAKTHNVTLITGDVVQVTDLPDGRHAAAIVPPTGGANPGGYQTFQQDKDVFLIPDTAAPYIASGRLDRALFNITRLIADGYDDAHGGTLPLLVTYAGSKQKALNQPAPAGARKVRALASVGAIALAENKAQAKQFWESLDDDRATTAARVAPKLAGGIAKIWLDAKVRVSLDTSVPQIGAPTAWADGYDGTGVKVAVLDTGIDPKHPDVAGQIAETKNFSGSETTVDRNGHGTHVASTVAGTGAAMGGKRKGVAPGARLLIGKVMEDSGTGYTSNIIAGMEWGAANAKVVSMSLGAGSSDGTDPLCQAVNNLTASTGALFVIAAGNDGPGLGTISTPGAADSALTVGAVDKTDKLANFSGRGPRYGDNAIKPEITAPGVGIVAARADGTLADYAVDGVYAKLSGTSMATPHVAGAAAILAQAHPDWTAAQLKAGLITTARTAADQTAYQQGGGRVDVAHAVRQKITASAGVLSLGYHRGPYDDAKPVTQTVTYRNGSDHETTLDLALAATTEGKPAADGMITVSPASLTVPAGASAEATVTLDLTKGELGTYGGWLTATEHGATAAALTTAIGYTKENKYRVHVVAIGRDGQPAAPSYYSTVTISGTERGSWQWAYLGQDSAQDFEVRPGQYAVSGLIGTMDELRTTPIESTAIAGPLLTVDKDITVTLDARPAKDIDVRVPLPTENRGLGFTLHRKLGAQGGSVSYLFGYYIKKLSAVPTPTVPNDDIEVAARLTLMAPQLVMRAVKPDLALHPLILGSRGPDGALVNGHHKLPVVYVGTGRPADYDGRDLRGKVALIRESTEYTVSDQVINAAAAKAALAIIVSKDTAGWFSQYVPYPTPVPTVNLPLADGNELVRRLGQGKLMLDLQGTPVSPYRYQLDVPFKGGIPENLTKDVQQDELATINSEYFAVRPGQVGAIGYYDARPYDLLAQSYPTAAAFPLRQTHYLLANDTQFKELVWGGLDDDGETVTAPWATYAPGSTKSEQWLKGPLVPGTTPQWGTTQRVNDKLTLGIADFLDSDAEHAIGNYSTASAVRVYRNGELVASLPHGYGSAPVGVAEPATYRVEFDVTQGRPGWTTSTESSSAWTFKSARGPKDVPVVLPLLSAGWDLDLGLANDAPAGKPFTLRLQPRHQVGVAPIPLKNTKVWVSFNDGGTWKAVAGLQADASGRLTGDIKHPAKANTSGFVSLRVQVTDQQGNRLEQTVMRAYALR